MTRRELAERLDALGAEIAGLRKQLGARGPWPSVVPTYPWHSIYPTPWQPPPVNPWYEPYRITWTAANTGYVPLTGSLTVDSRWQS